MNYFYDLPPELQKMIENFTLIKPEFSVLLDNEKEIEENYFKYETKFMLEKYKEFEDSYKNDDDIEKPRFCASMNGFQVSNYLYSMADLVSADYIKLILNQENKKNKKFVKDKKKQFEIDRNRSKRLEEIINQEYQKYKDCGSDITTIKEEYQKYKDDYYKLEKIKIIMLKLQQIKLGKSNTKKQKIERALNRMLEDDSYNKAFHRYRIDLFEWSLCNENYMEHAYITADVYGRDVCDPMDLDFHHPNPMTNSKFIEAWELGEITRKYFDFILPTPERFIKDIESIKQKCDNGYSSDDDYID